MAHSLQWSYTLYHEMKMTTLSDISHRTKKILHGEDRVPWVVVEHKYWKRRVQSCKSWAEEANTHLGIGVELTELSAGHISCSTGGSIEVGHSSCYGNIVFLGKTWCEGTSHSGISRTCCNLLSNGDDICDCGGICQINCCCGSCLQKLASRSWGTDCQGWGVWDLHGRGVGQQRKDLLFHIKGHCITTKHSWVQAGQEDVKH